MAETKCTPEAVENAIKEIQAAGRKVTVSAVMAITGGSKSTVCQLLRDWQASQPQEATQAALEDTITPELTKALADYRAHVLAASKDQIAKAEEAKRLAEELAKSEVEAAQEERDQAIMERDRALLMGKEAAASAITLKEADLKRQGVLDTLQGQLETATADLKALTKEHTSQGKDLAEALKRAEKAESELAKANATLEDLRAAKVTLEAESRSQAKELAAALAELDRTRATLDTLQETAKAAREDARLAREELREVSAGRVADLKEAASKPRAKAIEDVMPPQTPEAVKAREDAAKAAKGGK